MAIATTNLVLNTVFAPVAVAAVVARRKCEHVAVCWVGSLEDGVLSVPFDEVLRRDDTTAEGWHIPRHTKFVVSDNSQNNIRRARRRNVVGLNPASAGVVTITHSRHHERSGRG